MQQKRVMREVLIAGIYEEMKKTDRVYFLSGDFGAMALDRIREDFPHRFINVGIAEQNLLNIATGMALEGCRVYAYAIAPFFMRAYEQIRNLAITAQVRSVDVNLIGVGAGLSYEVSGPTHHCLEDLNIIYTLPNIGIFSPADAGTVERFAAQPASGKPCYIRLDGKPVVDLNGVESDFSDGFRELEKGKDVCILSTGFMTGTARGAISILREEGIECGLLDVFLLKGFNSEKLAAALSGYRLLVTAEEAFVGNSPLANAVGELVHKAKLPGRVIRIGFGDRYIFEVGDREYLHRLSVVDKVGIARRVRQELESGF